MKSKRPTKQEKQAAIISKITSGLLNAKTMEDLEAVNDLAEDAITAGILTEAKADRLRR
jgi:hypothetical protein